MKGDDITCTITNDDVAPTLTLVKVVVNDNGRDATADAWTLSAAGTGGFSGNGVQDAILNKAVLGPNEVLANVQYTLSESGPLDYLASAWSCVVDGGAPVTGATLTLTEGQSATCTITNDDVAQTGALLPTATTCQMYRDNMWPEMYAAFTYGLRKDKINSISPGVIFYYNTITWPAGATSFEVVETNSQDWKPMLSQKGQAILYNYDCTKSGILETEDSDSTTDTITFTGGTPGTVYIIGIKYSPKNVIGQVPGSTPMTSASTTGRPSRDGAYVPGSGAFIPLRPR